MREESPEWLALAFFALICVVAPLAFGAVDRVVQIGLLGLLACGLLIRPLDILPLGRSAKVGLLAFVSILLINEFGPAAIFGATYWRSTLTKDYGLALPWTHHPEPGLAVDGLLAAVIAVVWFQWVRSLAAKRSNRTWLAWGMFIAAAIVAFVSIATHQREPHAIYGLRFTPGWRGFGPFPNRNHTACFLAMGAVMGAGCLTWAGSRKKYTLMIAGITVLMIDFAGLLGTQSRGGLIGFGVGMGVFVVLTLLRLRSLHALAGVMASCLVLATMVLTLGHPLISRFGLRASADSNSLRMRIWHDTLGMWRDAPLFGHGIEAFQTIFPMYQTVELDEASVLHPESSWLSWLVELGALPVAFAVVVLAIFVWRNGKEAFARGRGFFLRSGGLAAFVTLLSHGAIDVPGHRWATMGYALAALALACPLRIGELLPDQVTDARAVNPRKEWRLVLVPLVVAGFWALPFLYDWPAWSPMTLSRLLVRSQTSNGAGLDELEKALRYFPLEPALHEEAGYRSIQTSGRFSPQWQEHFRIAVRLSPGSWRLPMMLAQFCTRYASGHAFHYCQIAIERGGGRRGELFGNALQMTSGLSGAAEAWASYAEQNPDLMLAYARTLPGDDGKDWYSRWWKERGETESDITDLEAQAFYQLAVRWGTPEQLSSWIDRHPQWHRRDFRMWAALLHRWGDDKRAWPLLTAFVPDPPFPGAFPHLTREALEAKWKESPANAVTAQAYAQVLDHDGDVENTRKVILSIATRKDAPVWFTQKAGYLLARDGKMPEAVLMLLRQ